VLAIGAGTATTNNTSWVPAASVFTIELWANVTGDGALAGIGGALESDFASLDVSEGRVRFGFALGDGTVIRAVAPTALAPGWHHIAGVRFEAQGAALYVDGELLAVIREPIDNTGLDGSGRLWIGSEGSRPPATATLDEVRISSVARYNATFGPPRRLTADADTIALYAFDTDTTGTVRDLGGGDRDLTLSATVLAPETCRDAPSASVCGDGERASWEACDDGNLDEGDGCDARCKIEVECPGELGPGGACYLFVTTGFSWRDARDNCRGWGGDLVVVDTATEAAWLSLIRGFTGTAWIGLNDRGSEGNYTWSSGASSSYRAWASGEPNNRFFSEDCVEQYGQDGGDNRARWNDSNCDDRRNAICER
jgi:cysteine-rich repeat protein